MFPVHMESSPSCSKINDKLLLIAKSIDLLGNPVYSVSCERAWGAGWPHPLSPSPSLMERGIGDCLIRFENTAIERRARSKIYTDSAWGFSVAVMHVADAPGSREKH